MGFFFRNNLSSQDYASLREQMVKNQIVSRGVSDAKVINAMLNVKRHLFVPLPQRKNAYSDRPLPIGYGQTVSQPFIVAYMTEMLNLTGNEKVLEIGTGSGYQAAVLSLISKDVYSIEIIKALAEESAERLKKLGYKNVMVKSGDGYFGWDEYAPFDAVVLTAAPKRIPEPLVEQLSAGGRLVAPVGEFFQELVILDKNLKGEVTTKKSVPVRFVPMTGEIEEKGK